MKTSELKQTTNENATGAILKFSGKNETLVTWLLLSLISNQSLQFQCGSWLMMVEVVRNNFEDLFPEINEAIEQSAFVG